MQIHISLVSFEFFTRKYDAIINPDNLSNAYFFFFISEDNNENEVADEQDNNMEEDMNQMNEENNMEDEESTKVETKKQKNAGKTPMRRPGNNAIKGKNWQKTVVNRRGQKNTEADTVI